MRKGQFDQFQRPSPFTVPYLCKPKRRYSVAVGSKCTVIVGKLQLVQMNTAEPGTRWAGAKTLRHPENGYPPRGKGRLEHEVEFRLNNSRPGSSTNEPRAPQQSGFRGTFELPHWDGGERGPCRFGPGQRLDVVSTKLRPVFARLGTIRHLVRCSQVGNGHDTHKPTSEVSMSEHRGVSTRSGSRVDDLGKPSHIRTSRTPPRHATVSRTVKHMP